MKKPRRMPAKICSFSKERNTCGRHRAMIAAATVKRRATKRKTEEWSRELLTTTKVEPQRNVAKARARSARSRLFCVDGAEGVGVMRRRVPYLRYGSNRTGPTEKWAPTKATGKRLAT